MPEVGNSSSRTLHTVECDVIDTCWAVEHTIEEFYPTFFLSLQEVYIHLVVVPELSVCHDISSCPFCQQKAEFLLLCFSVRSLVCP